MVATTAVAAGTLLKLSCAGGSSTVSASSMFPLLLSATKTETAIAATAMPELGAQQGAQHVSFAETGAQHAVPNLSTQEVIKSLPAEVDQQIGLDTRELRDLITEAKKGIIQVRTALGPPDYSASAAPAPGHVPIKEASFEHWHILNTYAPFIDRTPPEVWEGDVGRAAVLCVFDKLGLGKRFEELMDFVNSKIPLAECAGRVATSGGPRPSEARPDEVKEESKLCQDSDEDHQEEGAADGV